MEHEPRKNPPPTKPYAICSSESSEVAGTIDLPEPVTPLRPLLPSVVIRYIEESEAINWSHP